jgi:chromosome segregation protein
MTKINRITIHGFKSFAHKTEVPFDNSYNCILGPNGSGKSNIGDALCFVLGRLSAKSMRAEKAANLIFNGGKKNAPASKAYVEIAFDNSNKRFPTKDKEVVVNRSVSKSGTSTYRVNGQKRTRSEVLDTLGIAKINPDGYNIILQGDITKFVDSSPNERRKILEEISDVSVYEEKKHKATLELNKVDDKLNNAHIILKERKTYLRELKKDRDQALQFKQVQDNIDAHKATLLHLQIKEKEEIKAHFDKQIGEQEGKVGSAESKILKLKEAAEKAKVKITTLNKTIEQQGEKEQVKVHKNIEDLKVKLAEEKTRISTLKDEINKIQLRKDQLQEEMRELGEKSSSMAQEGKKLHHQLQRKKSEHQQFFTGNRARY